MAKVILEFQPFVNLLFTALQLIVSILFATDSHIFPCLPKSYSLNT